VNRVRRTAAPVALWLAGTVLLLVGVFTHPHPAGAYVSPHPWADYVTGGVIFWSVAVFETSRRLLRSRKMSDAEVTLASLSAAVIATTGIGGMLGLLVFR
jgi:hypothetical protein